MGSALESTGEDGCLTRVVAFAGSTAMLARVMRAMGSNSIAARTAILVAPSSKRYADSAGTALMSFLGGLMFQVLKRFGCMAIAAASICTFIALPACQPMSAEAEFQQARQQYAQAAERLAKEAKPITDRAALAKRLNLSARRFGVIKTGAQFTGPNVLAFDQGANCKMGHCSCYGDQECNEMFSGICRSPSTDGSCEGSGDSTVCSCQYFAGDEDTDTPTPTER